MFIPIFGHDAVDQVVGFINPDELQRATGRQELRASGLQPLVYVAI